MKLVKALLMIGIQLFAASSATCYFGVEHEIGKIPPEIRRGMSDTDWVGVEWIGRGLLILILAIAAWFSALIIWLWVNYFSKAPKTDSPAN